MNLVEKKNELIQLISEYLENRTSMEKLQNFSWEMIAYFSKHKKNDLPPHQYFEKEFWYTIWQIQHLADAEHEHDGITKKTLLDALDYLKEIKKIPENFVGTRP